LVTELLNSVFIESVLQMKFDQVLQQENQLNFFEDQINTYKQITDYYKEFKITRDTTQ